MCNRLKIGVKGVSRYTPRESFVPCGKCEECRESQRSAWTFRLRAEFEALQKKNWWFAFVTLTYNDSYLPHIPHVFVKNSQWQKYTDGTPQCFSKSHVRDFITSMRQWLFREYDAVRRVKKGVVIKDDAVRYLLGSELGEHTKRSHYHMVLALPPYVLPESVHSWIKKNWFYGFVFPNHFSGGLDSHGYNHMPFVIDSIGCATAYASKYVCKDIGFYEDFKQIDFVKRIVCDDEHVLKISDYLPFHMQSRSLGRCWLANLSDAEKLSALHDGVHFVGESTFRHLPVYLRNKLIYDNYYIFDKDGKRLCRREANEFFKKYSEQIFEKKAEFLSTQFEQIGRNAKQIKTYLGSELFEKFGCASLRLCHSSDLELAKVYLACGHVNRALCYDLPLHTLWLSPNNSAGVTVPTSDGTEGDTETQFGKNGHSYISLLQHGQLSAEVLQILYRQTNIETLAGKRIKELLLAQGFGKWMDSQKCSFIGHDVESVEFSQVISTSDTDITGAGNGALVGSRGGRGQAYKDCKPHSYHNDKPGYLITMCAVVPDSGYTQKMNTAFECLKKYDFYQRDFDGKGFEATKIKYINAERPVKFLDGTTGNEIANDTERTFGFAPRMSKFKQVGNILSGHFAKRSERVSFLPYNMDRVLHVGEVVTNIDETVTTGGVNERQVECACVFPVTEMPLAGNHWRYPTRYPWLGMYTRIFALVGDDYKKFSSIIASYAMLRNGWEFFNNMEDGFSLMITLSEHQKNPMLQLADSYETTDDSNEGSTNHNMSKA